VTAADLVALGLLALQVGFVLIMVVYLIAGLDDLFVDLTFFVIAVMRWLRLRRGHWQPTLEEMAAKPEQSFALMFPAWQESEIIRQALSNTISNIDYRNFHVFVGTYINDRATQREVEEVVRDHTNVTQIVVPHPGPTCKADCLNWIVKGIREYQKEHGIRFAGVILHDAEDVVDPLSLKLFNCMMPQYDLVQIPIISLERPWWDFIGGHYMDEFAEAHCKEIHVREWLAGVVPGAGVGTGYSMRALDAAAELSGGDCFSTDSLTEDYEFSFRVHDLGLKQIFVQLPIERRVRRRSLLNRKPRLVTRREFITTREFFPDRFWASVRQKTRWVIGIQLQGWRKFGWQGSWRVRYLYFRDRKALVTQQFMILGYIVAVGLVGVEASSALFPERYAFAPPLANGSPLWDLYYINVCLLVNRLLHRHYWTCRVYGWSQLSLIIPRYIVANTINYLAVTRASLRYLKHLRTGERIGWDKTTHSYPGEELLAAYRRRLGDILIERGLLTTEQLEQGLAAQAVNGRPLGITLVDLGILDEDILIEILCGQLRLARAGAIDPDTVPLAVLRRLPEPFAKGFSVFPIGEKENGGVVLACVMVPGPDSIRQLEAIVGKPLEFRLARRNELTLALRHGYARLTSGGANRGEIRRIGRCSPSYRPIGELLIDIGAITYPDLVSALSEAATSGKKLGEYLLANGRIREEQLAEAVARQCTRDRQTIEAGEFAGAAASQLVNRVLPAAGHVAAVD
jgi:bacteriophage N4 adsorption protein B